MYQPAVYIDQPRSNISSITDNISFCEAVLLMKTLLQIEKPNNACLYKRQHVIYFQGYDENIKSQKSIACY